jgi:membrane associated rhomboid family serine protease
LLYSVVGALFSVIIDPKSYSVGASVAIYGLLGAYVQFINIDWLYYD